MRLKIGIHPLLLLQAVHFGIARREFAAQPFEFRSVAGCTGRRGGLRAVDHVRLPAFQTICQKNH